MSDVFVRANRRLVRRLGVLVSLKLPDGEEKPIVKGIFSDPEDDVLVKGKSGGVSFKARGVVLEMLTEDCEGITKDWIISVEGVRYYCPLPRMKGSGMTLLKLSLYQEPSVSGSKKGDGYGSKWR